MAARTGSRPEPDGVHSAAASLVAREGHRYTRNRRAVVDVLAGAGRPLTVRDILRSRRGLIQSSVYQAVLLLEKAGVIHRVVSADEFSRYELAEDLAGHHHHLVCSNCGKVEDFAVPAPLERRVREAIEAIAAKNRFNAQSHRLDLVGLCRDCS